MAAGLGFKTFTTGEVLTAADTNGYLMQGINVFASTAARDAAITSPQEGQFAYLKDTNVTTYYTGSAWANLDTTGMTNPMTTTGDMVYSSSGSTPARLGIGTTGQVITVAGGIPSWATPASGGMTLLETGTLSGASVTTGTLSFTGYKNLYCELIKPLCATANAQIRLRFNADTGTNYDWGLSGTTMQAFTETSISLASGMNNASTVNNVNFTLHQPIETNWKIIDVSGMIQDNTTATSFRIAWYGAVYRATAAITSVTWFPNTGNWTSGTYNVYGVK
jgi:hypothetical protein